jgi:hypothetical protein
MFSDNWKLTMTSLLEMPLDLRVKALHDAMEGWGTDEGKLIRVLCALPKKQLRRVNEIYQEKNGQTLREMTDSELGGFFEGDFKYFMKCCLETEADLDAELFLEAMKGWGTDDTLLCELVCTRSNKELEAAKAVFEEKNGKPVEQWIEGDTSGGYESFLLACIRGDRHESLAVDFELAKKQAAELREHAGLDGNGGWSDGVVTNILSRVSVKQMETIKKVYTEAYSSCMMEDIKAETGGLLSDSWKKAMTARCFDKSSYYAQTLEGCFKGWGTDEQACSRIIGRNSKGDLRRIAARYEQMYGRTLVAAIEAEVGGNFKKALLMYLSTEAPGAPEEPHDPAAPEAEAEAEAEAE